MATKQDPAQAKVESAIAKLNDRTLEANEKRGDTRERDRKAAIAHQDTVDDAIAKLNERVAKANAKRVDTREKDRQAALAHQKTVDDAVADLHARRPDILQ